MIARQNSLLGNQLLIVPTRPDDSLRSLMVSMAPCRELAAF